MKTGLLAPFFCILWLELSYMCASVTPDPSD